jgi:hypothetical protein
MQWSDKVYDADHVEALLFGGCTEGGAAYTGERLVFDGTADGAGARRERALMVTLLTLVGERVAAASALAVALARGLAWVFGSCVARERVV